MSIPASDLRYQDHILAGVSRTFALTIPELPAWLRIVVGNAYLLCRIADTVEDDPHLPVEEKQRFLRRFCRVVEGRESGEAFAAELCARLSPRASPAERDLVAHTARVVAIAHAFEAPQRAAIERCVQLMTEGMAHFQAKGGPQGLETLADLEGYCYCVAGVVGEMLTELFCQRIPELAPRRQALQWLALSFGQGLQMTNILKDVWEDRSRGACWLPRAVFEERGCDLGSLTPGEAGFRRGMEHLIGVARWHLERALDYTLLIPKREQGIRRFCLWALGMAVLTLANLRRRLAFHRGDQVKISRGTVRATVTLTSVCAGSNGALRLLFRWAARGLPPPVPPRERFVPPGWASEPLEGGT
ncbi:phytoene/squalene synthase family protein [Pelomicrobium sp.]|jgi:farnesyl-diphosphate farnesyltransferase|uniref:phytoene/squalene synthase family protein n=1 Tax=Pelomicrobium sp. TaxID=2815319 RepID=UPI002FDDCDCF